MDNRLTRTQVHKIRADLGWRALWNTAELQALMLDQRMRNQTPELPRTQTGQTIPATEGYMDRARQVTARAVEQTRHNSTRRHPEQGEESDGEYLLHCIFKACGCTSSGDSTEQSTNAKTTPVVIDLHMPCHKQTDEGI